MNKYLKELFHLGYFLIFGIALINFLFASRRSETQRGNKFFWGGMTLLSLSAPVAYLRFRLLPRAEYVRLFDVFYIALFICGFYLLLKGAKIVKEAAAETLPAAKPKDISKPVGLVFGIITIPFSAVAFFAALGALTGVIMTGKVDMNGLWLSPGCFWAC